MGARMHCALLNDQALFDPASFVIRDGAAPGISLLQGCRKGSKTEEGIAYRFDPERFTELSARTWLVEHKIEPKLFEPAPEDQTDTVAFSVAAVKPGEFTGTVNGKPGRVVLSRELIEQCRQDTNDLLADGSLDVVARMNPGESWGGAKLGHAADQAAVAAIFPKDGLAALGHMTQLRWVGDTLAADFRGVSKKFTDLLKRGLWNARSAELLMNWTHPVTQRVYPMVMKSLCWLGSEMPAVPVHEIWGLAASHPSGGTEGAAMFNGTVVTIQFSSATGQDGARVPGTPESGEPTNHTTNDSQTPDAPGKTKDAGEAAQQAAEEKPKMGDELQELKAQMAQLSARFDASEGRATAAEATVEAAKKRIVTDALDRARDERRITPAQHDEYAKVALGMSFDNALAYVATMKDRPQAPDPTKPLASQATGTASTDTLSGEEKIVAFAADFRDQKKGSFAEGVDIATRLFPKDAEDYLVAHNYHGKGGE